MEIDFLAMPSWALVSTNNGDSNNIPPIEPINYTQFLNGDTP
jgi:hypothetical protein